jgi:hypothetical protein
MHAREMRRVNLFFSHNGLMPGVVGADAREYLPNVFVCAAFCFLCPFVYSYPRPTIPHRSFLLPPCSPHRILPFLQLSTRLLLKSCTDRLNPQNTPAPKCGHFNPSAPPRKQRRVALLTEPSPGSRSPAALPSPRLPILHHVLRPSAADTLKIHAQRCAAAVGAGARGLGRRRG